MRIDLLIIDEVYYERIYKNGHRAGGCLILEQNDPKRSLIPKCLMRVIDSYLWIYLP